MNEFPFEFKNLSLEEIEKRNGVIHGNYFRVGPKGYILPAEFKNQCNDIFNLQLRTDDVFISGFCRSGTTWTQEMVWLMQNNLDFQKANMMYNSERVAILELAILMDPEKIQSLEESLKTPELYKHMEKILRSPSELIDPLPSPRTMKTHLPLSLLPPDLLDVAKVVYIFRDPRDVIVSLFKIVKNVPWHPFRKDVTFNKFFEFFIYDAYEYTPYFEGVKEAWEKRYHPNMLFLYYEDLIKDLPCGLRRVAKFLNKQFSDEDIAKLCEHLDIKNMKKNIHVNEFFFNNVLGCSNEDNFFVGKGGVGGWRQYFDEQTAVKAEKWINDNLEGTDFKFPY